jgi:hypothetical protein
MAATPPLHTSHRLVLHIREAKNIISPQGDASLRIQGYALIYWRECDIIYSKKGPEVTAIVFMIIHRKLFFSY